MTITEAERQQMQTALEASLGPEEAKTLMEHLPPTGWTRVEERFNAIDRRFDAIDRRLDAIDLRFDRVDARIDRVEDRFEIFEHRILGEMHREFVAQNRSIIFAFVTSLIGFGGMMLAAVSIVH